MGNEILDTYGINNFPRYFGYPSQILVKTLDDLKRQMQAHAHRDPLYISHNSHNREWTIYAQMFSDFDAHETRSIEELRHAQKDCQKFVEYHMDKTDILVNFTGGGFHPLLKFQPQTVRMADISSRIRGYQKFIKDYLDLKTMDIRVAEPGRLFRIPLSPYVYNDNGIHVPTPYYDIPIDVDTLFNSDIEDLLYLSKTKQYSIEPQNGKRLPLSYLDKYELKEEYHETEILEGDIDFYSFDKSYFLQFQLPDLMNQDDIIIKSLLSVHPDHNWRRLSCLKLKDRGLSYNSACSFFERLSEIAAWDNRDLSIQRYQIRTIYDGEMKMRVGRG